MMDIKKSLRVHSRQIIADSLSREIWEDIPALCTSRVWSSSVDPGAVLRMCMGYVSSSEYF